MEIRFCLFCFFVVVSTAFRMMRFSDYSFDFWRFSVFCWFLFLGLLLTRLFGFAYGSLSLSCRRVVVIYHGFMIGVQDFMAEC